MVADSGNEILGMAFASTPDGRIIDLHQFYVLPAAQGKGAGRALLGEIGICFPEARLVRLEAEAANTKAVDFYAASGFQQAGQTDNCGRSDSGIAALVYEKPIG